MKLFHIQKTKKSIPWTTEEDEILISHTNINRKNRWKAISKLIPGKTAYLCYLRFRCIHPTLKKGHWTNEEDLKIREGIKLFGRNWSLIARNLFSNRNAKQIRDRYTNYLDPSVNKGKFSISEDLRILELFNFYGSKWSLIQKHLKTRSPDAIKNRFNSSIKRSRQLGDLMKLLDENKVRLS
jgi:hypothetical protein